jgi:hypothetical protein
LHYLRYRSRTTDKNCSMQFLDLDDIFGSIGANCHEVTLVKVAFSRIGCQQLLVALFEMSNWIIAC